MRVAFVTYPASRWRDYLLRAKYLRMRLERIIYPDVYSIPRFLTDHIDLVPMGATYRRRQYDLIFSELNGTVEQLSYLHSLVMSRPAPVAVIPGPPEILSRSLTNEKLELIGGILSKCDYLLAYSRDVATFFDGLAGRRSILTPWPFDYERTRALGLPQTKLRGDSVRILLNTPMRFAGPSVSSPMAMKSVLKEVLGALPEADRQRITFHTFIYSGEDRHLFDEAAFARDFPIRLERKRGYSAFIRFVGSLSGVINFSPNGVLGRLAFATACLDIPGIYSDNVALHRDLYPNSCQDPHDMENLRSRASMLATLLLSQREPRGFQPDERAARTIGAFSANAEVFRGALGLS